MTNTVDLIVVGVSGDVPRDELSLKLVEEFGQEPSAFQGLLDGAFGEVESYAAQSGVNFAMAEEGKAQLEQLGIVCKIVSSSSETSGSKDTAAESVAEVTELATEMKPEDQIVVEEAATAGAQAPEVVASNATAPVEEPEEIDFSAELGEIGLAVDDVSDAVAKPDNSKNDVPEALESASFEELSAELIDPAPKVKEKKEPVVLDDGGLSLSEDDSQPLTAAKRKSDPNSADDGGLSLDTEGNDSVVGDNVAPLASAKEDGKAKDALVKEEAPLEVEASLGDALQSKDADLSGSVAEVPAEVTEAEATVEKVEVTAQVEKLSEVPTQVGEAEAVLNKPASNKLVPESVLSVGAIEEPTEISVEKVEKAVSESVKVDPVSVAATTEEPVAEKNNVSKVENIASDSQADTVVVPVEEPKPEGLVLPGQAARSVVPTITAEEDLDDASIVLSDDQQIELPGSAPVVSATTDLGAAKVSANRDDSGVPKLAAAKSPKVKKIAAALAGVAVLAGGATFALKNMGSDALSQGGDVIAMQGAPVQDAKVQVQRVKVETGDMSNTGDLENLSTEQLLINLSVTSNANTIVGLEPYFLESVNRNRSGPRFGAAVPAESNLMVGVKNRVPHPADTYFDEWSNREADLLLFLALLDNLIDKGELDVAQQLADRAKDKLFAVMSSQRLARAYSEVGNNEQVTKLMKLAARDTFAIVGSEERVLAISDYGLTEQAIGLNEDSVDTFLKASILARNLGKPELKAVGLSSTARYFKRSGREREAQVLLEESLTAGLELPKNTAARDLAVRYVALTEARMGLFNQALEHVKTIVDPFAMVSAYHGVALAIESTGDDTSARRVLNMAYRAGSGIADEDERSELLSKVILASESE